MLIASISECLWGFFHCVPSPGLIPSHLHEFGSLCTFVSLGSIEVLSFLELRRFGPNLVGKVVLDKRLARIPTPVVVRMAIVR